MRIAVTRLIPESGLELLRAEADVALWPNPLPPGRDEIITLAHGADGLLTLVTDRVDGALLDALPSVRVVSNYAVGFDNIDVPACTARDVAVCTTPDVLADATADYGFTLLLAAFSIGTALGSLACERLSGHKVEIGLVPLGSIGMTVCLIDLYFEHPAAHAAGVELLSWKPFLAAGGWDIALDCALIGVFGGLFIVPLYALILSRSVESHRARIIACNNILNAGFMVLAALMAIGWFALGFSIPQLFILAGVLNALVAAYIYTLVPEFLMRFLTWVLVNVMYRIKVRGLENIPESGPALLVSNHVSFMDALVIGGSVRRPVRFVMDLNIFRIPVLGFIFRTAHAIPIAPAHEDRDALRKAFDQIDAELAAGEVVCIFPEGKLTRSGEMNEFKTGVERILDRRAVPVVPMALRGLWGSFFSRRDGKAAMSQLPRRFWSRIELIATAPVHGAAATAAQLQRIVAGLRGEWQ